MPIIATASTICGSSITPAAGRWRAMRGPRRSDLLKRRFGYAFEGKGGYPAVVDPHLLPNHINLGGISVRAVDQPHGPITSAGLRFDAGGCSIGYSTDFNELTDDMAALFEGLDLWVVDALRRKPHPTHPHLADTLEWIQALGAEARHPHPYGQQHGLSHLAAPSCPTGVEPGYDGMEVEL